MNQLALNLAPVRRESRQPKIGQLAKLLTHLQTHGSITTLEASDNLRICRLSQRIIELERLNCCFDRVREKTAGGATVTRYRLK